MKAAGVVLLVLSVGGPAAAETWKPITPGVAYDEESIRYHAGRDSLMVHKRVIFEDLPLPPQYQWDFVSCRRPSRNAFNETSGKWLETGELRAEDVAAYRDRYCALGREGLVTRYEGPLPPEQP